MLSLLCPLPLSLRHHPHIFTKRYVDHGGRSLLSNDSKDPDNDAFGTVGILKSLDGCRIML